MARDLIKSVRLYVRAVEFVRAHVRLCRECKESYPCHDAQRPLHTIMVARDNLTHEVVGRARGTLRRKTNDHLASYADCRRHSEGCSECRAELECGVNREFTGWQNRSYEALRAMVFAEKEAP